MCKLGFSPNKSQLKDIVWNYVTANNIHMPFTNNWPGKDWVQNFMRHNKLSTKKANIISSTQKSSTLNPFLIHDFYDGIKEIITTKKTRLIANMECRRNWISNRTPEIKSYGTSWWSLLYINWTTTALQEQLVEKIQSY